MHTSSRITSYSPSKLQDLATMADRLRKHCVVATSAAGSGHPTSCFSCAELMSVLFFHHLRFDMLHPDDRNNDRFILSKGHAAPILWAALSEAGAFPQEALKTLRRIDSELEGHPTPRNRWVDVATGSLGQGLSAGVGMALGMVNDGIPAHVYVLMGDGETAEGSVWEAAALASHHRLQNLVAIVDVNRMGQSGESLDGDDMDIYATKFRAFGWEAQIIDGHDLEQVIQAFENAVEGQNGPQAILASTIKGKGVPFIEERNHHGKPFEGEELEKALSILGDPVLQRRLHVQAPNASGGSIGEYPQMRSIEAPAYQVGDKAATRQAYGNALRKLGRMNGLVWALDGDVKNSTYADLFAAENPDRFVDSFIAEQNMVGMALGLSVMGKVPFVSTFASFFTRAFDQIRMASLGHAGLKLAGSHVGISIGEDGPSQMGLEDMAMFRSVDGCTVLYPSDAVSAERLTEVAARLPGMVYLRLSRPKTNVLYTTEEKFEVGGSKVLRSGARDKLTFVAAGITVHEALTAADILAEEGVDIRVIDAFSIEPIDKQTLLAAANETGGLLTIEDHHPAGGLGDAVLDALSEHRVVVRKLAVRGVPRSGDPKALMRMHGIDAEAIATSARNLLEGLA